MDMHISGFTARPKVKPEPGLVWEVHASRRENPASEVYCTNNATY